ncbi:hypothetical protein AAY473_018562, partial [Plecturocebus cupreus]
MTAKASPVNTEHSGLHFCLAESLLPGWSAVVRSWPTATSAFRVQEILLLQPPDTGITGVSRCTQPCTILLKYEFIQVELLDQMEFHSVTQAAHCNLHLPDLSDSSTSVSQITRIIGHSSNAKKRQTHISKHRKGSHCVAQAKVQWCNHGSLQHQLSCSQ